MTNHETLSRPAGVLLTLSRRRLVGLSAGWAYANNGRVGGHHAGLFAGAGLVPPIGRLGLVAGMPIAPPDSFPCWLYLTGSTSAPAASAGGSRGAGCAEHRRPARSSPRYLRATADVTCCPPYGMLTGQASRAVVAPAAPLCPCRTSCTWGRAGRTGWFQSGWPPTSPEPYRHMSHG